MTKGLIIAGTHSGVGKTTLTLGLMAALRRQGLQVAPFKVGPDFIDPGHHAHVVGRPSHNLDGWMLDKAYNQALFQKHCANCDIAVVEGVMGLFDGYSGRSEAGSTAQMAKWLNLPVLLVVNAASMARSAAALVQGYANFDKALRFCGILFNQLGSQGHYTYLQEAMQAYVDLPLLGGVLRNPELRMPERHLGLTTVEDRPLDPQQRDLLADHLQSALDLDRLLANLPRIQTPDQAPPALQAHGGTPVRIGVARDRAFCFYYPDNLDLLEAAGAELVAFSPLTDRHLPEDLNGIYFGGGYPELHARELAENADMRNAIFNWSRQGMPIYGECGGFMYLCRELVDMAGERHPMCGCFPFQSQMHDRLRTLGYREVRLVTDTLLGSCDQVLRGHEFHYSNLKDEKAGLTDVQRVYATTSRAGRDQQAQGYQIGQTLGSYVHLHFGSGPQAARAFVAACRQFKINENFEP